MDNTHEWCADGVEPQKQFLKNHPVGLLPWWADQIRSHKHVHIPDVEALSEEAAAERLEWVVAPSNYPCRS